MSTILEEATNPHVRRSPRCGAWMPYAKEPCARLEGHRTAHRTAYALANAYRSQVGREREVVA